MSEYQVTQLNTNIPWHITQMNGYVPVTNYWERTLEGVNIALMEEVVAKFKRKDLLKGLRDWTSLYSTANAKEWAEKVMTVNHALWLLYEVGGSEETQGALHDLYYELHDQALNTLKGDELSEYLRITD